MHRDFYAYFVMSFTHHRLGLLLSEDPLLMLIVNKNGDVLSVNKDFLVYPDGDVKQVMSSSEWVDWE